MIANLIPAMGRWYAFPTAFVVEPAAVPGYLRWGLSAMAAGVFLSGARDLYAALDLPHGSWPWKPELGGR
jgi:hypothetical protein